MFKRILLLIILFFIGSIQFSFIQTALASPYVKTQGRQLVVDFDQDGKFEPYFIKGVAYEPMPVGRHVSDWGWPANYPADNNIYNDDSILTRDFANFRTLGINTIRIWQANDLSTTSEPGRYPNKMTTKTLTYAGTNNIKIIAGFTMASAQTVDYSNATVRSSYRTRFQAFINAFKNRSEILFWVIGNENNYSMTCAGPTVSCTQAKAYYSLVNQMAADAKGIEGANYHPVAIVDGDIGFIGQVNYGTSDADLNNIDIWGSNVYRTNSFGTLFNAYQVKSNKPFYIAEYGTDTFHTTNAASNPITGAENQTLQATWDGALWDEIASHRIDAKTIGGTIMEYSDEWWKPYEWNCEDVAADCRDKISSSNVTFKWDVRPSVSTYHLNVSTGNFGSGNVFNADVTGTSRQITTVPTGVTIFVQLSYFASGRTITEYQQFAPVTPLEASNTIKIKLYGSQHNNFVISNSGNSPDNFWNEEWWGLMSIARNGYGPDILTPRAAFNTLKQKFTSMEPWVTFGSPTGTLAEGTGSTTLSVATDVDAICKYDISSKTYASMVNTMSQTGGKQHTANVAVTGGNSFNYYVRCKDSATNVINTSDYLITFSVPSSLYTYNTWKAQKFTVAEQSNAAISGLDADPDYDGMTNIWEYAFNMQPKISDQNQNGYSVSLVNDHLVVRYRTNLKATDIESFQPQVSADLFNWTSTFFSNAYQPIDSSTELIIATDPVAVTSVPRRFIRLSISLQGGMSPRNVGTPPPGSIRYTLTVNKAKRGTVVSASKHIQCGDQCSYDGLKNEEEVLTAYPYRGYRFAGWSGDCTGIGSCVIKYNAPKTVQATFVPHLKKFRSTFFRVAPSDPIPDMK